MFVFGTVCVLPEGISQHHSHLAGNTHPFPEPATTLAAWLSSASSVDCTADADGGDTDGGGDLAAGAEPVVSSGDTTGAACVRGSAVAAPADDDSFSGTDTDKIAFQFISHFSRRCTGCKWNCVGRNVLSEYTSNMISTFLCSLFHRLLQSRQYIGRERMALDPDI